MAESVKVGIIACSGEEIPAGTLSRLATRRVLESLRPQSTVTLCLPLFLAGEEQERRFAQLHPTITVDGCDKLCAKRGTERYSGQVAASLVVTDILGQHVNKCHRAARDLDWEDEQAVWVVADRIAAEVDSLAGTPSAGDDSADTQGTACGCSCGSPPPESRLTLNGTTVTVNGLPLIFDHLYKQNLKPAESCDGRIVEMVRIYHGIPDGQEKLYREALAAAYLEYFRRRSRRAERPADSGMEDKVTNQATD